MGNCLANISKEAVSRKITPTSSPLSLQKKLGDNPFQAAFQRIQTQQNPFSQTSLSKKPGRQAIQAKCGPNQQEDKTHNPILEIQGSGSSGLLIQRDLATPLPEETPEAQEDLSAQQIREALRFNRMRYDADNTQIIQDIVGTEPTGTWTEADIRAIAQVQESYGLQKDGKVGESTFAFIQHEQDLEGVPTSDDNCLTMFRVVRLPSLIETAPGPGGSIRIRGHHYVEARFSPRCNCGAFEYRQFIAGVAMGSRGGRSQDFATSSFPHIPGGQLPLTMQEDGNTTCPGTFYGHRDQPGQEHTTSRCGENQYRDDQGNPDQAQGCFYRGEDFPQIRVDGLTPGDDVDLLIQFRGEIRRHGVVVQTKNWTTVDEQVRCP